MNESRSLLSLINQRLDSGLVELPVFDDIALQIHREVRESRLDADGMCRILEEDPVLVSELLRMANSSFFAGLSPVSNLREAAVRLGLKQIASIVLSVSQKRMYSASAGMFKARLTRLWLHTSAVSIGARWLASNTGYRNLAEDAYVAGLLHDVGKLSLLCIIEDLIVNEGLSLTDEIIDMTLRQMYCQHGAQLLANWNLPQMFRDIILQQNDEQFDDANVLLCMVRLVDEACVHEHISDLPGGTGRSLESLPETQALGLSEIDLAELRLVLEDVRDDKRAAAA